jgi:hypothetical protein
MNLPAKTSLGEIMETVLIKGDLSKLNADDRMSYYKAVCDSVGLNALTKPFEYITLNNKLQLYALKACTDQLRAIHDISVTDLTKDTVDGVHIVTAKVQNGKGRTDADIGAVNIAGLKGEAFANAIMKASCVPLDSEILTRNGFKTYDQITIGDEVLAYDCGSDKCVWTPLLDVQVYKDAPLICMQSTKGQFSVRCTPDHSWAIQGYGYRIRSNGSRKIRGPYKGRKAERRLIKAHDIKTSMKIILAAPEIDTKESVLTPIEAAILGWAVTDGTIQRRGSFVRVGICQSKEENFETIREIVGSDVKEIISPSRYRTFPLSGKTYATLPQHWWYLPSAIGRALLKKAGFESRADLPKIATLLDAKSRAAMLQAFMLAEGDKRGNFHNGDHSIMETFEILCALQGIASGTRNKATTIWKKRLKKTRHIAGSFLTKTKIENANVWCPTTAFGTWIMRQDHRVMITGNTKAKRRATLSICGLGMLDETEVEDIPQRVPSPSEVEATHISGAIKTAPAVSEQPKEPARHQRPKLLPPQKNDTFDKWAVRYIEALEGAQSTDELSKWDSLNDEPLGKVQNGAPQVYAQIEAKFEEMRVKFQRASISTGPITPPSPPADRPAGIPNAERDPDGFIVWSEKRMAALTSAAELDVVFENEIDPATDGMFPPDYAAVQAAYEANKKRLGGD